MKLSEQSPWFGTATQLLDRLVELAEGTGDKKMPLPKGWPKTPSVLSNELKRLAPNLRAMKILVAFNRTSDARRKRTISIKQIIDRAANG